MGVKIEVLLLDSKHKITRSKKTSIKQALKWVAGAADYEERTDDLRVTELQNEH